MILIDFPSPTWSTFPFISFFWLIRWRKMIPLSILWQDSFSLSFLISSGGSFFSFGRCKKRLNEKCVPVKIERIPSAGELFLFIQHSFAFFSVCWIMKRNEAQFCQGIKKKLNEWKWILQSTIDSFSYNFFFSICCLWFLWKVSDWSFLGAYL